MAVFTHMTQDEATRLAQFHGLGRARKLIPIAAGSVNSNFFLETDAGKKFARIYEEQDQDGVQFEWKVLEFLHGKNIPVPKRISGVSSERMTIQSKPTAVFELVDGDSICQKGVTEEKLFKVGEMLAKVHRASRDFSVVRKSRFSNTEILNKINSLLSRSSEFKQTLLFLKEELEYVIGRWPAHLPSGLIHGDLFRDNVFWVNDEISALIDWESASHGFFALDLMITLLAWCFDTEFKAPWVHALIRGYQQVRPLDVQEIEKLQILAMGAALRFAFTRIQDFELKESVGERVYKDYRRFMKRYEEIKSIEPPQFRAWLEL